MSRDEKSVDDAKVDISITESINRIFRELSKFFFYDEKEGTVLRKYLSTIESTSANSENVTKYINSDSLSIPKKILDDVKSRTANNIVISKIQEVKSESPLFVTICRNHPQLVIGTTAISFAIGSRGKAGVYYIVI